MNNILAVGSLAYDDVETPFDQRKGVLGGAACYFALAASIYAPVRVIGVVGDDFAARDIERLARKGIDVSGIERKAGRSFHWSGRYDYELSGRETLATELGVFGDWRPVVPAAFADSPFVFLANIDPEIQLETLNQMREPVAVALDTMNFWIEQKRDAVIEVISRVDIVSINEGEARELCGTSSVVRAAREILALGPRALIVKRGEYGATLFAREGTFWAPAFPLESIQDPTGAGDTFAGGFLGYLATRGNMDFDSLRQAVVHGAVAASFAVEHFSVDGVEGITEGAAAERYKVLRELVATGAEAITEVGPFAAQKRR